MRIWRLFGHWGAKKFHGKKWMIPPVGQILASRGDGILAVKGTAVGCDENREH